MLVGEVIHVDDFGNVITNIHETEVEQLGIKETIKIKFKSKTLKLGLQGAYAEVASRKPLAIIGSHNFLEISINKGNAGKVFNAESGDKITVLRR